jgi:ABC-type multidrug transport system fused ATPase/permease subunit
VRYALSLVLAILLLPLFLVLSLLFLSSWWLGLIFFFALPLSGLFAWNYYLIYKRITGGFRIRKYISGNVNEFDLLSHEHKELVNLVSVL